MAQEITIDYPAAHSMDTTWFGVDANGEIAVFETGDSGEVPGKARSDTNHLIAVFGQCPKDAAGLLETPIDGTPLLDFCDPDELWLNMKKYRTEIKENFSLENLVVLYEKDADLNTPLETSDEEDQYTPYDDTPPGLKLEGDEFLVIYPALYNLDKIEQHYSLDLIKAVAKFNEDQEWVYKYLGIHFYAAGGEERTYAIRLHPLQPLNISSVKIDSEDEEEQPEPFTFHGVSFSDTFMIQPNAFDQCHGWDEQISWLGFDGSVNENSQYKNGQLLNEYGEPYTQEEILKKGRVKNGEDYFSPDEYQEDD